MSKTKQDQTTKKTCLHAVNLQECGMHGDVKVSPVSFSTCVRVLMQNWRQGTVGSQGRSDVSLTNKKPWKQKGTGRARAGSARSPLWRGGGVTFGPQARTKQLKINRKVRSSVLGDVLRSYVIAGKVLSADWEINATGPKTTLAYDFLKKESLLGTKVTVFITQNDQLTYASFVNIPNVSVLYFDQVNVFDLTNSAHWIVLKKDMDHFKTMVSKWN